MSNPLFKLTERCFEIHPLDGLVQLACIHLASITSQGDATAYPSSGAHARIVNCFFCVLSLSSFSAWFTSLGRFHSLSRGFIRCSGLECGCEAGWRRICYGRGPTTVDNRIHWRSVFFVFVGNWWWCMHQCRICMKILFVVLLELGWKKNGWDTWGGREICIVDEIITRACCRSGPNKHHPRRLPFSTATNYQLGLGDIRI